jgi:CheY-like chemotaxis protein
MVLTACSESLMIVDDNELLANGMKRLFSREFREIATAASGQEAMAIINSRSFTIVTLDIGLPDVNGLDLLLLIKQLSPDSIVFVISSRSDAETRQRAFVNGAFGFLEKPVDMGMLKMALTCPVPSRTYEISFNDKVRGMTYYLSDYWMFVGSEEAVEYGTPLAITLYLPDAEKIQMSGRAGLTNDWLGNLSAAPAPEDMKHMFYIELVGQHPAYQSLLSHHL